MAAKHVRYFRALPILQSYTVQFFLVPETVALKAFAIYFKTKELP